MCDFFHTSFFYFFIISITNIYIVLLVNFIMAIKRVTLRKYLFWGLILGVFSGLPTPYMLKLFPGEELPKIQEELQIVRIRLNSFLYTSNLTKEKLDKLKRSLATNLSQIKTSQVDDNSTTLEKQLDDLDASITQTSKEYNNLKDKFNGAHWERTKQVGSVSIPAGVAFGLGLGASAFALRRKKELRSKATK